ncbi:MAG TPA: chromosomal replication initiator protein DnaA [Pyrinomonadaceae bacterium]|nr:chromosomal replication initiator protein DnaA [Pyrinomonadaceae bacterium]
MEALSEKTEVWQRILQQVESHLNKHIFDSWFRQIKFVGLDEQSRTITLSAGQVTKDWVEVYYNELIINCLEATGHSAYSICWEIDPAEDASLHDDRDQDDSLDLDGAAPRFASEPAAARPGMGTTNFVDIEPVEHSLNPKYTFEKFVVGSSNQFAHAAAMGAADTPGKSYNPLFIYGGTGLGKTHLMHAIGHSIKQKNRHMRVSYITSEKFMNELINAIRYDKTDSFREKYRSIDVLLMDDVQFFAGKERTQEEFFHTFNTLHNNQKQIVISSDCPPREIPTLEERLHSRFEWGLIADIEPPDLETKVAILKRKADLDGIELSDEIAIFIASKIKSNVRELEGSLVRLVAISSLRGIPISKMLAQDAMKNIIDSERPEGLSMERIAKVVASQYKLTVDEMMSKSNSRAIAFPRQIAMYLCKRLTKHSFPEIGREFGGKHHTTVMHSCEKIDQLTKDDRVFHNTISELIDSLCS